MHNNHEEDKIIMVEVENNFSKINNIFEETKEVLFNLYKDKLVDIILFGSYARGEENKESDINLAVIIDKKISPSKEFYHIIDQIYDLDLKYNVILSIHPIPYKYFLKLNTPFISNLKRDGISLYQT